MTRFTAKLMELLQMSANFRRQSDVFRHLPDFFGFMGSFVNAMVDRSRAGDRTQEMAGCAKPARVRGDVAQEHGCGPR
jgi:hypothetical protein